MRPAGIRPDTVSFTNGVPDRLVPWPTESPRLASSGLPSLPCTPRHASPLSCEPHRPPLRLTLVIEQSVLHHWARLLLWKAEWSGGPVLGPLPSPLITGVKGASAETPDAGNRSFRSRSKLFPLAHPPQPPPPPPDSSQPAVSQVCPTEQPEADRSYLPHRFGFLSSCGGADSEGWGPLGSENPAPVGNG